MNERAAIIIIWSFIIADLLSGLLFNLGFSFYRLGLPLKSATVLLVLLYYLGQLSRPTILSIYWIMATLCLLWVIGSLTSYYKNPGFDYGYSFVVLNRYFFFLILSCIFFDLARNDSFEEKCKKIFESFFILNNALIFIGVIFNLDMLSTYDPEGTIEGQRFGYKGLIRGGNDVAGVYIFGVGYFFREKFKYGLDKGLLLTSTCLAALLMGTKATLIAVPLISLYYLVRYRIRLFLGMVIPSILLIAFFVSRYWDYVKENYLSTTIDRIQNLSLLTYLMTNRNEFLIRHFKYIASDWMFINHLAGDAFLYSETDFFDLYFFFGLLGMVVYFYFYVSVFFRIDKSLDNLYFFLVLMAIAFTAGHIIQSAVVPIFFLLYVFSAKRIETYDKPGSISVD
jgi:hypothetical protein